MPSPLPESLEFLFKKITVIVYVSIVNFLVACLISPHIEKNVLFKYDTNVTKFETWLHLCIDIAVISTFAYFLRQISEMIPLPFKDKNFDPSRVKEVKGSVLTAFTLFLFFGDELKSFVPFLYGVILK